MKLSKLKDQAVLVKLADPDCPEPVPVTLLGEDDTGIWFQNKNIA